MGYDRDATPEEIERSEAARGSNKMPESTKGPAAEEQPGPANEADPHGRGHEDWAPGPSDGWFTATELIDWGYRPEA